MSIYEEILDDETLRPYVDKRIAQGIEQGGQRAAADAVLRVIRHRFGTPSATVTARVTNLSLTELEALQDAVLDLAADADPETVLPRV